ncbi:hypothetical protein BDA96_09G135800 [Sorghum bicolor]|uniref:J domain-containing protein n=2 Tax=Sorghum bicolor TaxID=4558 RepID=A0A921U4G9_SORBI|nr:hypothetical protein SORBI_3009G129300 [Sorghum bicolor]KAG0517978.1 hypothetical protein BDA96_09G135800 [Sorghum bicolor]
MMSAVASSFPSRGHAAPFGGSRALPPPPSTRRSTSLRRPRVSALGGGLEGEAGKILDPRATPFQILGLDATTAFYSAAQLKAAFRARVKEFHPDVCKDPENADLIMRRVIEAYQMLSGNQEMMVERNNVDPFDEPECEARDIFVNELLCIGTGCPYSCVKRAPHVFSFSDDIGTARAISQGNGEDDLVQLAVGQCPRKCIYYVTPCQRTILEDVLASVLMPPYDIAEAAVLDSLLSKAKFENNRYRKPKRGAKSSSDYVDWM